ncbi:NADH dehydrogenase (ubiquinone) complex I, assembly factor 6-like isoform X2 [Haliotis rufescens]|uniref:NADH dehydrogenase (ubiquinone) complex I, assembly factor 6-like isoform X2 n=1 Tax=Haliotis rufescens TaxID=6454 RepID=UPI00201EDE3A|nr:NADH dehydrogenase (ubiquinone) complex I, assembly factor 6-like isoform X2 [Haliotis rufescens]
MPVKLTWSRLMVTYRQCRSLSTIAVSGRDARKQDTGKSRVAMSTNTLDHRTFCKELVRKNDYENYLCCLLLPGATQRAALAIRAFNVELAQVRETVSDKQRGILRMQFWKDSIDHIYKGSTPKTPVATELAGAIHHFKLTRKWLTRIIEARAHNLSDQGYRNMEEVEAYAENSVSSITYLLLECLGIKNVHADHAASHIGKTQGLVTLLRSTPYHASRSRVYLPLDLIVKHKISQEKIIRGRDDQAVKDVMYDVACTAHKHLATARSLTEDVPKEASLVFLNTVVCEWYLKALQNCDFNVFDSRLQQRNSLLPLHLWLQKRRKTY